MMAPDPDWLAILASDAEDDAWREQQDRLDREREHAPAPTFAQRHGAQGEPVDAAGFAVHETPLREQPDTGRAA